MLTTQEIDAVMRKSLGYGLSPSRDDLDFARAIESAATKPLLQRIAELEAANEGFAQRQEWWNARMFDLERQLEEARNHALEEAAKVCDELAELSRTSPTDSMWQHGECAAAIRALKGAKE